MKSQPIQPNVSICHILSEVISRRKAPSSIPRMFESWWANELKLAVRKIASG